MTAHVSHEHYPGYTGVVLETEPGEDGTLLAWVCWLKRYGRPVSDRERQRLGALFPVRELVDLS